MADDVRIIHKVTKKLEETLSEINQMLAAHLGQAKSVNGSKSQHKDKSEKKGKAKDRKSSQSDEPESNVVRLKRPMSGFFLFAKEKRPALQQRYPDMPITEISENLGKVWKNMSEEDKSPYNQQSKRELEAFYRDHPEQKKLKRQKKQKKQSKKQEQ